jgi:hypothetical protein
MNSRHAADYSPISFVCEDYQFAPRWVVGGFVDADWSNVSGHAKQAGGSYIAGDE